MLDNNYRNHQETVSKDNYNISSQKNHASNKKSGMMLNTFSRKITSKDDGAGEDNFIHSE